MGLLSLIYLECSGFEEPKAKDPTYMQWPGALQGTHSTEKTKRKKKVTNSQFYRSTCVLNRINHKDFKKLAGL